MRRLQICLCLVPTAMAALITVAAPLTAELITGSVGIVAGGGLGEGASALQVGMRPTSTAVAADGGLWIADEQFNLIRRVAADGRVFSVAGTGVYGFNGSGLPALHSHLGVIADLALDPNGRLLAVDLANRQIRRLDTDGVLHTFVDAHHPLFTTVAGTFAPASVAIGPHGRVHVADRGTHAVWQFDEDGQGRRVAGNGTRGYAGDGAPSALGQLADPRAVAVGPDGAIWIADTGNGRVRVVAPDGRLWTAASGLKPVDLAVGPGGQVYVLDATSRRILRLGPAPGFVDGQLRGVESVATLHQFDSRSDPVGIDLGADGHLYVADRGTRQVLLLSITTTGAPTAVAGNGSARASGDGTAAINASLYGPSGLARDRGGNLWFADRLNDRIRRVDSEGVIHSLSGSGVLALALAAPQDVAFDREGRLYIADTGNDRVLRIEATGTVTVVAGPGAGQETDLRQPTALAFDATGALLIADSGNGLVRRLQSDGTLVTIAGDPIAGDDEAAPAADGAPAGAANLVRPVDIQVDGRGDLWIADAGAHRVYKVGADGLLRVIAGTGAPGLAVDGGVARRAPLHTPTGIESDAAGGLVIADSGNGRLVHVDADGILRVVTTGGSPQRVLRGTGDELIYTDGLTHQIKSVPMRFTVRPVAQRVLLDEPGWRLQTLAALPLQGLQEVRLDTTGASLVTSRGAVTRVGGAGQQHRLLSAEADRFRFTPVSAQDFGASLLLVTTPLEAQPKPMTLARFAGTSVERFDLDFQFDGADAVVVDATGDVLLHQASDGDGRGRLVRLPRARLLNIPGFPQAVGGVGIDAPGSNGRGLEVFALLPAEAAALAPAPTGGVYVALRGSRDILLVRDTDGDGQARGPLEQRRLAQVPEPPIAVAVTAAGDLFVATVANRLYRVDAGGARIVARGFAPELIDVSASADGGLLVLEGDARGGRLLSLSPARPEVVAWPEVLSLGPGALGAGVEGNLVVRNDGLVPVRVTPESSSASIVPAGGVQLAPGALQRFEVRWTPTLPGPSVDEILWRDDSGQIVARQIVTVHARAPRLSVSRHVDAGILWVGGRHLVPISLRNDGDAELRVASIEIAADPGASATLAAAGGFTLAPGDSTTIDVTLIPRQRGDFNTTLRLHSNDPLHGSFDTQLSGRGGGAQIDIAVDLSTVSGAIDLGAVPVRGRGQLQVALRNSGDLDLRIDRIATGTLQLLVTPRWLVVPAGASRTLQLDFLPATHGRITGELTLWTNDPVHPKRSFDFVGRGLSGRIELAALAHDFGTVSQPVVWSLEVTNLHTRRMRLLNVATDNPQFRVIQGPRLIEAGATASITVEFHPAGGLARAQLLLRTDLVDAPEIAVALQGRRRVAQSIRFEALQGPVAVWPGENVSVPVEIVAAAGLRGAVFDVSSSAPFAPVAFTPVAPGPVWSKAPPLVVSEAVPGGLRVGLSLTGDGNTTSASGRIGLLQFRTEADGDAGIGAGGSSAVLPAELTVLLSHGWGRSADGSQDSLETEAAYTLQIRWRGDINADGQLDMSDVFALVDRLDRPVSAQEAEVLDLNEDGAVDAADVRLLVEHLPGARRPAGLLDGVGATSGLLPPFPNPFNAETTLLVVLANAGPATLTIYNLIGQTVRAVVSGQLEAGVHRVHWDGRAADGAPVRSGVYFAVLQLAGERHVQRLLLLR